MHSRVYLILIGILSALCVCLILFISISNPVRVPFQGGLELFGKFFFGGDGVKLFFARGDSSSATILVPSCCALIEIRSAYVIGMWPGKAVEVTGTARRELDRLYFVAKDDGDFYFFESKDLITDPARPVKGTPEFYDLNGKRAY